jgi:peptide/nickel transport system substrate-binding protein
VCIEEIRVASIPNGDTLRDAMRNQERDIAVFQESIVSAEARAEFKGWDAWNQTGAGMTMNEGFGEGEHAAEDQRVKMAMAKAIDPEVMHQRGYGGFGFPANSIIHPDHPLHPGVEGIAFDPEGAAALVEEAKADGWDGVVRYDCIPVPEAEELSIAVQSLFENVGMTLKISLIPISELISKLVSGNVDLTCASPIAISEGSLGSAFLALRSGAPGNLSGYADPKMDVAIEQLLAAQSIDETKAALAEIQKVHNEHPVGAVYGTQKIRISYQDRVHGLLPTQLEEFLWHRAYVDQ